MRREFIAGGVILLTTVIASGCWATPGKVMLEIAKVKKDITLEQTKERDEKIRLVNKRIDGVEEGLKKEGEERTKLQTELYNLKQEMMQLLDERVVALTKQINENRSRAEKIQLADTNQIDQLHKDLLTTANVFRKKLEAERDGLERAIIELEKLSLPQPEGAPEMPLEEEESVSPE